MKPKTPKGSLPVENPTAGEGKLKHIGGSKSDTFNNVLANHVLNTLWLKSFDQDGQNKLQSAAVAALAGIGPRDETEGMLAAQMVAAHNAAMECYRRAMIPEQPFEGRKQALDYANKLSRTYTTLLEALNRHRGKGQQKVTVEHVHVHAGGQAIVGTVEAGGWRPQLRGNPMQRPYSMHLSPRCGAKTRSGSPCRSPAMLNGRCRMHGGSSPGAPKGDANGNYRHGRFTCESIEMRRQLAAWIREMNQLAKGVI